MNKKELKASIILSGIVVISLIVNYLISKSTNRIWLIVFVYFVIALIIGIIRSKYSNRFIVLLNNIISFPLAIAYALLMISNPIGTIVIHTFLYYLITGWLPLIFKLANDHFKFIVLSFENFIFLSLTFSTIVSIAFYKYIIQLVFKLSPFGLNDTEKEESVKLKELVNYIITPQNIRFFIYSIYFVYLCIFSYNYIDGKSSFAAKSTYSAIMQAFLVFLAFDSLRINSKEIRFLPSILLHKVFEVFSKSGLKDEDEKIEN
jgi:hypothetical protein